MKFKFLKKIRFLPESNEEDVREIGPCDLLPIGSVVLLKEGEKRLMIIGVLQRTSNRSNEEFDYLGVIYPEGYIDDQSQYLFNHEDIDKIFFLGYDDEERVRFLAELTKLYKS